MSWYDLTPNQRLEEVLRLKDEGYLSKEVASIMGVGRERIRLLSRQHNIVWDKGTQVNRRNDPTYGTSRNAIKRKTAVVVHNSGRDLCTCERCGFRQPLNEPLPRHHKDRNRANNDPSNLEVLCQSCHSKEHLDERSRNHLGQFETSSDCGGGLG